FTWLPLTTLDQNGYVDHHLLFHILQIPFTWFGNLTLGAKVAATIFGSLAVFSCYWLIVRYRISYTLVWLLALLSCSGAFLYRLNMAKAPPIAIIFMVAGIYLLFEKRYWVLAPLMFLFVWTYSLFPTLLGAAVIWSAVIGWSERRFEWRPIVWTLAGMTAGLVINPYFPKNIVLFIEHARMKLTPGQFSTDVGQEWYPYDSWVFLGNCAVACAAMVTGYVAFHGQDRVRSARALFFLIFSTILMIATFKSRRFVEYWPPFAILFAAFSLQPVFEGARGLVGTLPAEVLDELEPFLDKREQAADAKAVESGELWKTIVACFVALALFAVLMVNVIGVRREIASSDPPDKYRAGMKWVSEHVPAGERVFNTDWDDFPRMFFFDPSHAYISGLDPTYLLDKNRELAQLYDDVTLGHRDDPAQVIRDRFGARYVFSDQEEIHDEFYAKAMNSGWFDKVYEDDDCFVLHIRDQQGEPPPESADDNASDDEQGADANDNEADLPEENNAP
ncbi:MAG: hypothetical protein JO360_04575, partial [Acidobacteria bacterium]|nr:hypothetical protein [Acidobacteriota bacterium]